MVFNVLSNKGSFFFSHCINILVAQWHTVTHTDTQWHRLGERDSGTWRRCCNPVVASPASCRPVRRSRQLLNNQQSTFTDISASLQAGPANSTGARRGQATTATTTSRTISPTQLLLSLSSNHWDLRNILSISTAEFFSLQRTELKDFLSKLNNMYRYKATYHIENYITVLYKYHKIRLGSMKNYSMLPINFLRFLWKKEENENISHSSQRNFSELLDIKARQEEQIYEI